MGGVFDFLGDRLSLNQLLEYSLAIDFDFDDKQTGGEIVRQFYCVRGIA